MSGVVVAEDGLTLAAANKSGRAGAAGASANSALIASVETILSECRFPSRLALGRSFSLKQERRKALHAFLAALVSSDVSGGRTYWSRDGGTWVGGGAQQYVYCCSIGALSPPPGFCFC